MVPREYKSQEDEYDYYKPWTCVDFSKSVNHTKYKPVCRNVTKENCVTTWEISPTGEKVCYYFLIIRHRDSNVIFMQLHANSKYYAKKCNKQSSSKFENTPLVFLM